MLVYDIYEHPRHGITAIKNGFSWSAFLAPSVWAAAKGLGAVTLMLVIGSTLMFDVLKIASDFVPQPAVMLWLFAVSYLVFGLRPGIEGNFWHASKLRTEGFQWRYTVAANGRSHALESVRSGQLTHSPRLLLANAACV